MAQDKENPTDNKDKFAGIPGLAEVIGKVVDSLADKAKEGVKALNESDKNPQNKGGKSENLEQKELVQEDKENKGQSR